MRAHRYAAALIAAELLLTSCSFVNSGNAPAANTGAHASAKTAQWFVPAPCPSPESVDPLAGIEGWAPGAGKAAKMGQSAAQNFGGFGGALSGGSQTPAPTPSAAPADCKELSPDAASVFAGAGLLKSQAYTAGFDLSARAAQFHDVQSAFAYVRDRIRTEPYAGAMRGAQGTLMARAGSPADKAALLAALLSAQNVSVRYAHVTLAGNDAQQIVAAAVANRGALPAPQLTPNRPLSSALSDAQTRLASLQAALSSGHVPITGNPATAQTLLGNVRDHWWLQVQQNGSWVDADPSLANAVLGTHLGAAPVETPDALPDSIQATISFRLLADVGDAQNLRILAQASTPAWKAVAVPISVSINGSVKDLAGLASQTSFPTNITIGDDSTDGQTLVPDDSSARLRVLYLETTIQTAGAPARTQRHIIVDRRAPGGAIDPSWDPARTAYALTTVYLGEAMPGDLDPAFAVTQILDALTRGGLLIDYVAQHPGLKTLPEGASMHYPVDAQRYFDYDAAIRSVLVQRDASLRFFYDRPQLAFYRQGFAYNAGAVALVQGFDIVDNAMTAVGNDARAAAMANATRGLADTNLEAYVAGRAGQQFNTAMLFASADSQHIGTAIITAQTISKAPPLAQEIVAQTLADSSIAYAPATKVSLNGRSSYGWLSVDTQSGNVVGRMASGAGQALSEYVLKGIDNWPYVKFVGSICLCDYKTLAEPAHSDDEKVDQAVEIMKCGAEAVCDLILDLTIAHGFTGGAGMMGYDAEEREFLERVLTVISQGSETGAHVAPASDICEGAMGGGE